RTISKVAVVLLAAGESRRWGADNKLLAPLDGKPMVQVTAAAILKSSIRPVLVMTGHEADMVSAALQDLPVAFNHAPDFADGMAASLKAGIAAVPADCTAARTGLGDMSLERPDTLGRLAKFHAGQAAVFPTYNGKRGNPVLLARPLFTGVMNLSGDEGARRLLRALPD